MKRQFKKITTMIINKPYVEVRNDHTFLISLIKNEVTNVEEEFYFSVSNAYAEYLCDEIADAFVVAMLIPALMSGQDIRVKAPVSEMLLYRIENGLTFILSKTYSKKPISVLPDSTGTFKFNPKAVATGFSGGVDSFATVLQHTSENCTEGMRLTHLALFNVGAYGNDESGSKKLFNADAQRAKQYAEYINMPLVLIESNISKAYEVNEITHGFSPRSSTCIMAAVLSLQKLFRIYLIAGSDTIDHFRFDKWNQNFYESLVAYYLSAAKTTIVIANEDINRIEKMRIISENEQVKKFLYVCPADYLNEKSKIKFTRDTKPNCSECTKCLRTLVVLDLMGCLDEYENVFDLQRYEHHKSNYLKYILQDTNTGALFREIYELMKETGYKFPKEVQLSLMTRRFKDKVSFLSTKARRFGYFKIVIPLRGSMKSIAGAKSISKKQESEKFKISGSEF